MGNANLNVIENVFVLKTSAVLWHRFYKKSKKATEFYFHRFCLKKSVWRIIISRSIKFR